MSKPRYIWWSYVRGMVKQYPELKEEYNERKEQRITRNFKSTIKGTEASRSTENVALQQLPASKQAEYDAVTQAIEKTKMKKNGEIRLALIDMVFWKQSHTLGGAAYKIGYSYDMARRYQQEFLRLVGLYRGLMDYEEAE